MPVCAKTVVTFEKSNIECVFSWKNILFNLVNTRPQHICNLIVLITKQYLFRCKCSQIIPNIEELNNNITNAYVIERYNDVKDCTIIKTNR